MNQKKFEQIKHEMAVLMDVNYRVTWNFESPSNTQRINREIYETAKQLVAAYEEISDEDIKEMAKMPFQVMPLPKSRTQIDVEIVGGCYSNVRQLIKKICEDHENKRDVHIRVNGLVFDISDAEDEISDGIKSAIKKELDETFSRCASKIDGGLATKVALEVLQEAHTEKTAQEQSPR